MTDTPQGLTSLLSNASQTDDTVPVKADPLLQLVHMQRPPERPISARRQAGALRRRFGFERPLPAIAAYCATCQKVKGAVEDCTYPTCPLWAYRLGRRPTMADMHVAVLSDDGTVVERICLAEFLERESQG